MLRHNEKILIILAGACVVIGYVSLKNSGSPYIAVDSNGYVPDNFNGDQAAPDNPVSNVINDVVNTVKNAMTNTSEAIANPNVQAFLILIRTGEGTSDPGGYHRLFGGGDFNSYADHPRIIVTRGSLSSTAAGAYQILARTWDDLRNSGVDLPDFTPANQDKAAIALIKRRGALADVIAGNFKNAIARTNKEWASLPGSPYGQPTLTLNRAYAILAQSGADMSNAGFA